METFTLRNTGGLEAVIGSLGATLESLQVPDRDGKVVDVTLGFDTPEQRHCAAGYFGVTVGRFANRIAGGTFTLDGVSYTLARNKGPHHLHGGLKGFDKVPWKAEELTVAGVCGVKLSYLSADGEEGYPGNLSVTVVYSVTDANELRIQYIATTDKPTIINLTNHTFWNLAGAGDILGHALTLWADHYLPVDETLIPTGEIRPVAGTPMDFTSPKHIGTAITDVPGGYDHNYILRGETGQRKKIAEVFEPTTGRVMEVTTTEPGVQFYSGNFLDGSIVGRGGVNYQKHTGFCLETQHWPDAPHWPEFPSVVLRETQEFRSETTYKFSTR